MSIVSYHILARMMLTTTVVLVALVTIAWVSQIIRLLDFVVVNGRSFFEFIGITMLFVPMIIAVIMPTAIFVSTVFVLDRMNGDSELTVIGAAGISRWRLLRPFLAASAISIAFSLVANIFIQPLAMNSLREKQAEIRSDIMSSLIDVGQFTSPHHGLMIHVKERTNDGELKGIIFKDTRTPLQPITYLSSSARLIERGETAFLHLIEGSVLRNRGDGSNVDLVHFEEYTLNLLSFFEKYSLGSRRPHEMYINELFYPSKNNSFAKEHPLALLAEAHNRLSNPLYSLVALLIAFAILCDPRTTRTSRVYSIVTATILVSIIRVSGIFFVSLAGNLSLYIIPLYAIPIIAIACTIYYMIAKDRCLRTIPLTPSPTNLAIERYREGAP